MLFIMSEDVSDLAVEGELEYYFADDSLPVVEVDHFLPGASSLPDGELYGDEKVPKAYDVRESKFASVFENKEVREFKQENYRDIRDAGAYLDEVLFDIDNSQEMLESDIRNRLTEAYQSIMDAKKRVARFETDRTSFIYTDESKQEFMNYLDSMADKIKVAGWRQRINVEREVENRMETPFDAYTALEPVKDSPVEPGDLSDTGKVEGKAD